MRFLLVIFLWCLPTTLAFAEKASVEFHLMPYGQWLTYPEPGKADGIFGRTLNRISEEAGVKINFNDTPYARVIRDVTSGKKIIFAHMEGDPRNPAGENHHALAVFLNRVDFGVMVTKGLKAKVYSDLKGRNVGFFLGASQVAGLTDDPDIQILALSSEAKLLELIQRKRLDAIWLDPVTVLHMLAARDLNYYDLFEDSIYSRSGYPVIVTHKDHKDDPNFQKIAKAATKLHLSGELDAIAQDFLKSAILPSQIFEGAERPPLVYKLDKSN